ncbi:erythromycin esterase family protein [Amycolatopsis viridis]|uniref:Erythromycin esterase n=1 Tax=Amycolatopsis viridis TaxID=185678 RepID=A0ABX0STU4_9PSEU|nr:erythromycin esterase family protein [Amycolatopsis viridis]NIH80367.1 erythromycin esterase [Amycolatopsis viridis]
MTEFADWLRAHAHTVHGLDLTADVDDLEPLREIVGDARVVGLGEGAHFVAEFTLLRQRVLRFLAERCGFTVLAFEFGFSEGFALDDWLRGAGDADDLSGLSGTTASGVNQGLTRWLREYNAGPHPLRFAGLDIPLAGGDLRPALEPVAGYLRQVDPDAVPLLDRALEINNRIAGTSVASAAPKWAELGAAEQDALTASLSRLLLRLRALEPLFVERGGQESFDRARRRLEAACHADYMFGAMSNLFAGRSLEADTTVRELYLTESLRWHLDRLPAGARVVLAAHNNHLQRTPVAFGGQLTTMPMGQLLHRVLGDDYRPLALTHTANHVPEMYPDGEGELGFKIVDTPLAAPEPGSVEAGVVEAGLGAEHVLVDLRHARRDLPAGALPDRFRTQSVVLETPVAEAFDGVLVTPMVTTDDTVGFAG